MGKSISIFIALLFFAAPAFTFAQYDTQAVTPAKQKTTEDTYSVKQQKPVRLQRGTDEPQVQRTNSIQLRVKDTAASLKEKLLERRTIKDTTKNGTTTNNKNVVKQRSAAEDARIAREKHSAEVTQKKVEQQKQQKPVRLQRGTDEPQVQRTNSIQLRVKDTAASLKEKLLERRTIKDTTKNGTTTNNKNVVKQRSAAEDARIAREKHSAEVTQKRVEQQKQLAEKRKERIRAYFARMFTRLDAAIERFNKLITRIESRIQKLEERGVDVADAREKLQKAQDAVAEADFKINAARGLVEDILSGEDPKKIFENTREAVKSTVEHIKQAHRALVDSIVALKGATSPDVVEENE